MAKFFFFLLLLPPVLWIFSFSPSFIQAATALQMVVAECRQRTGFGDSTCKTLVKKYMNVERCKEYTGYSDDECAKKIEEIKKDPDFSLGGTNPSPVTTNTKTSGPSLAGLPPIVSRTNNTLAGLREKKEGDLLALWKRTEAMTNFLKSKGVDTQAIEAALPEFQKQSEMLLSAYDTYQAAYEGTVTDSAAIRKSVRSDARESVIRSMRGLVEYYQAYILVPLRVGHEKLL